jgi:hypothetical protein
LGYVPFPHKPGPPPSPKGIKRTVRINTFRRVFKKGKKKCQKKQHAGNDPREKGLQCPARARQQGQEGAPRRDPEHPGWAQDLAQETEQIWTGSYSSEPDPGARFKQMLDKKLSSRTPTMSFMITSSRGLPCPRLMHLRWTCKSSRRRQRFRSPIMRRDSLRPPP